MPGISSPRYASKGGSSAGVFAKNRQNTKERSVSSTLYFTSNVRFPSLHDVAWRTLPAAISLRAVTISRLSVTRSGLAPFKSCFALFDARTTSRNRLATFSRQSSTVTRAISMPSTRFMKTTDNSALNMNLASDKLATFSASRRQPSVVALRNFCQCYLRSNVVPCFRNATRSITARPVHQERWIPYFWNRRRSGSRCLAH